MGIEQLLNRMRSPTQLLDESSEWGFFGLSCLGLSKTQEIMKRKKEKYGIRSHDERFRTEEDCRNFLITLKWDDGRPACHHCDNKHLNYYITSRDVWKCSSCKKQFSLTKHTIFENSKLPLKTWFKAIYFFSTKKRGVSSCQLAEWLEVEQKTAWFMLIRLREALEYESNKVLSGIVEVDETYIAPNTGKDTRVQRAKNRHEQLQNEKYGYSSKRKTFIRKQLKKHEDAERLLKEFNEEQAKLSKNGKRTPFNPALATLGLYERDGRVLLFHLGRQYLDTTKKKIAPYLINHISKDAELVTDESSFYTQVGQRFLRHRVVHHDITYVSKEGIHTNGIENVWNHLKRTIQGTYFHLSFWHFYRYLNEHAFRWNVRKMSLRGKFDEFVQNVFGKHITYAQAIVDSKIAA